MTRARLLRQHRLVKFTTPEGRKIVVGPFFAGRFPGNAYRKKRKRESRYSGATDAILIEFGSMDVILILISSYSLKFDVDRCTCSNSMGSNFQCIYIEAKSSLQLHVRTMYCVAARDKAPKLASKYSIVSGMVMNQNVLHKLMSALFL